VLRSFDEERLEYAIEDHDAEDLISSRSRERELALRTTGEICSKLTPN